MAGRPLLGRHCAEREGGGEEELVEKGDVKEEEAEESLVEEEVGEEPCQKRPRRRERVARLFHRDGRATHLAESLPVAGYGVSALHALQGNQEHARRAAGRCTNSNLALCGGLVGGLGGGPAGAALPV